MKEWMIKTATILFDDSKNDLYIPLPKTVRLQLLTTLSFVWSNIYFIFMVKYMTYLVYGQVYAHIWTYT